MPSGTTICVLEATTCRYPKNLLRITRTRNVLKFPKYPLRDVDEMVLKTTLAKQKAYAIWQWQNSKWMLDVSVY